MVFDAREMEEYKVLCYSLVLEIAEYFENQHDTLDDSPDYVLPLTRREFLKLIDKVTKEYKEVK